MYKHTFTASSGLPRMLFLQPCLQKPSSNPSRSKPSSSPPFSVPLSQKVPQHPRKPPSTTTTPKTVPATADSTIPTYFLYHKFYHFRSLPLSPPPPLVTANQRFGTELAQDQSVLNSSAWNHDWEIQNWGKKNTTDAPVAMQNSAQSVFIVPLHPPTSLMYDLVNPDFSSHPQPRTRPSHLALHTTRLPTFQSVSEIDNLEKNLLHASIRFQARVITPDSNSPTTPASPDAVAGLFTFVDDNNESPNDMALHKPTLDPKFPPPPK
ncbi:glycoside hydrolase family protein [Venturia nashicola]|uniref:Glycoside hydrolase family 16 protein n=1 Tax=Venturia nashicola TaxID=86259 RepID=A0A4Z1P316_9PEZI|nr:glycoside hydrolase family 16 protein [Venturia nashicola]TLD34877.1 glycoside hydrolase family protein [Venturia nashicola]